MSVLACLALIATTVVWARRLAQDAALPEEKPPKAVAARPWPWWSLALRGVLEGFALFVWLYPAIMLAAWLFWIGDNDHSFWDAGWMFVAALAGLAAAAALWCTIQVAPDSFFARFHLWQPIALLIAFAGVQAYEHAKQIEGSTPQEAAENILARQNVPETVRLEPTADHYSGRCFMVMGPNGRRGRICVSPHGRGWKFMSWEGQDPFERDVAMARSAFKEHPNEAFTRPEIERVVASYPGTPEAKEAAEMLQELDRRGEPPVEK